MSSKFLSSCDDKFLQCSMGGETVRDAYHFCHTHIHLSMHAVFVMHLCVHGKIFHLFVRCMSVTRLFEFAVYSPPPPPPPGRMRKVTARSSHTRNADAPGNPLLLLPLRSSAPCSGASGVAWRGVAWRGVARRGVARRGVRREFASRSSLALACISRFYEGMSRLRHGTANGSGWGRGWVWNKLTRSIRMLFAAAANHLSPRERNNFANLKR